MHACSNPVGVRRKTYRISCCYFKTFTFRNKSNCWPSFHLDECFHPFNCTVKDITSTLASTTCFMQLQQNIVVCYVCCNCFPPSVTPTYNSQNTCIESTYTHTHADSLLANSCLLTDDSSGMKIADIPASTGAQSGPTS